MTSSLSPGSPGYSISIAMHSAQASSHVHEMHLCEVPTQAKARHAVLCPRDVAGLRAPLKAGWALVARHADTRRVVRFSVLDRYGTIREATEARTMPTYHFWEFARAQGYPRISDRFRHAYNKSWWSGLKSYEPEHAPGLVHLLGMDERPIMHRAAEELSAVIKLAGLVAPTVEEALRVMTKVRDGVASAAEIKEAEEALDGQARDGTKEHSCVQIAAHLLSYAMHLAGVPRRTNGVVRAAAELRSLHQQCALYSEEVAFNRDVCNLQSPVQMLWAMQVTNWRLAHEHGFEVV